MFRIFFIAIAVLILMKVPAFAVPAEYSSVIEDLPLMPGMVERSEDAVIFDKPGGRIVETYAETKAPVADIRRFYAETLPPLGWKKSSSAAFVRDGETLELAIDHTDKTTVVHFNLAPDGEK